MRDVPNQRNAYVPQPFIPIHTNDGCYLVHAYSNSCAQQINEQSDADYQKNIIFKEADSTNDDYCSSYIPPFITTTESDIDLFKAYNENIRDHAKKEGSYDVRYDG